MVIHDQVQKNAISRKWECRITEVGIVDYYWKIYGLSWPHKTKAIPLLIHYFSGLTITKKSHHSFILITFIIFLPKKQWYHHGSITKTLTSERTWLRHLLRLLPRPNEGGPWLPCCYLAKRNLRRQRFHHHLLWYWQQRYDIRSCLIVPNAFAMRPISIFFWRIQNSLPS